MLGYPRHPIALLRSLERASRINGDWKSICDVCCARCRNQGRRTIIYFDPQEDPRLPVSDHEAHPCQSIGFTPPEGVPLRRHLTRAVVFRARCPPEGPQRHSSSACLKGTLMKMAVKRPGQHLFHHLISRTTMSIYAFQYWRGHALSKNPAVRLEVRKADETSNMIR